MASADGAGVTSGLPWTTEGSADAWAVGTGPIGPVPPPQAAATLAIASRVMRMDGERWAFMDRASG